MTLAQDRKQPTTQPTNQKTPQRQKWKEAESLVFQCSCLMMKKQCGMLPYDRRYSIVCILKENILPERLKVIKGSSLGKVS